ncbi:uncharacterized protein LOC117602753 isoform X1 [Osmia lignaria lignaria]|uniref:uncharacterized protein LOC117602753 isoform X1 n=2 Tax=Osmia lignaria lignaria TaxID=1437193 RepID=UPI00402B8BA4
MIGEMNGIESYVTCPFNESHRILRARFQMHLVKCSKNYPKHMKEVCPFDATHRLVPEEFEHHLTVCPSSGNVQCYQNILGLEQNVGTVSIQQACDLQTTVDDVEDWSGNNPSYNPFTASEKKNVLRIPIAMSKSEKKKFKLYERQRLSSLENNINKNRNDTCVFELKKEREGPLRTPKHAPAAVFHDASTSTNNIVLQLKNISIDKNNETSVNKNSTLNNDDSGKDNKINTSINTLVNDIGSITNQKNSFQFERKENMSIKKTCTNATEKKDLKANNILPKLIKHYTFEQQRLNVQNGILYGEPKKVSTGRGFILACKRSNPNTSKKQEEYENSKSSNSPSDYEDD